MAKPVITDNPVIDYAVFNNYTIIRRKSGSIEIQGGEFKNTKAGLREISTNAGIEIKDDWNTQYMGWYIIQQLNGKTAKERPSKTSDLSTFDYTEDAGNGLIYIKKDNKWGFADKSGNVLIEPKFDGLGDDFIEGMIVTRIEGKGCGFVNAKGEEVVVPSYKSCTDFHDGYASVVLDGEEFKIDTDGNRVEDEKEEHYSWDEGMATTRLFLHLMSYKKDVMSDDVYESVIAEFYKNLGCDNDFEIMTVYNEAKDMSCEEALAHIKGMSPHNKRDTSLEFAKVLDAEPYGETFETIQEYIAICTVCELDVYGDPANEFLSGDSDDDCDEDSDDECTINGIQYTISDDSASAYYESSDDRSIIVVPDYIDYNGEHYPVTDIELGDIGKSHTLELGKNLKYIIGGRNILCKFKHVIAHSPKGYLESGVDDFDCLEFFKVPIQYEDK